MSKRYDLAGTGRRDDQLADDGDAGFLGVNMKLSPEKLPPGICRALENKVCRKGAAEPREGLLTTVHHNPRLQLVSFAACDFLLATFEWSEEANGSQLAIKIDQVLPAPAVAGLVDSKTGPLNFWPGTTKLIETEPTIFTGTLRMVFNWQAMIAELAAPITLRFFAQWGGDSQSAGGDARVKLTLVPYHGGSLDGFTVTGGTAGAPRVRYLDLLTDTAFFTGAWDYLGELKIAAPVVAGAKVLFTPPAESNLLAFVGTSHPPYVASLPALAADAIFGVSRYADRAKTEWLLLATRAGVWKVRDGRTPLLIATPEPIAAPVEMVQFVHRVTLFRGEGQTPWEWEGGAGFAPPPQTSGTSDGTAPIPGAVTAEVINNRLAIPVADDSVIFSDLLDARRYDPALAVFRLNSGTEDSVVRLFPYANSTMLVFKSRSIGILQNLGQLAVLTFADITKQLGLAARKGVAMVGGDVFFLSGSGVFRLSQVLQDRIETEPVPISDPIEPFFRERMNWRAAGGAVAQVLGEYFYLAVPIDGATTNNALLVFNTATNQWEGFHTFPARVELTDLVVSDYQGRKRLFATDAGGGWCYLVHEGPADLIGATVYEISDRLLTRGYLLGDSGRKDFRRGELTIETWRPSFSVAAETDGVNERRVLITARTKSRQRYYIHARPDYVLTNANDDHAVAQREDYSVNSTSNFQLRSGIVFDRHQATEERMHLNSRGRWMSLEITNTQGRCSVLAARVEARQIERAPRLRS